MCVLCVLDRACGPVAWDWRDEEGGRAEKGGDEARAPRKGNRIYQYYDCYKVLLVLLLLGAPERPAWKREALFVREDPVLSFAKCYDVYSSLRIYLLVCLITGHVAVWASAERLQRILCARPPYDPATRAAGRQKGER